MCGSKCVLASLMETCRDEIWLFWVFCAFFEECGSVFSVVGSCDGDILLGGWVGSSFAGGSSLYWDVSSRGVVNVFGV
jgi:hypothetical protein